MERLKNETAGQHKAVEQVVPLMDSGLTLRMYRGYLERMLPFYLCLEGRLQKVAGLEEAIPDLEERWKTPLLEADVAQLSGAIRTMDSRHPDPRPVVPEVPTIPRACGALYVLEGATLGAQIQVRHVGEQLAGGVAGATRFLQCYGDQIGPMWRRFRQSVVACLPDAQSQHAAIDAARATFSGFHAWLQQGAGREPARQ